MRLGSVALLVVAGFGCESGASSPLPELTGEVVTFPSRGLVLHGILYRPPGPGPFPAVLYNHGSAPGMMSAGAAEALGPAFASRGWLFFMPFRRGQGLSASAGPYIGDELRRAESSGGKRTWAATMVHLLETDHLNDQLAGLAWLGAQPFVDASRIAVGGNSFGGIEVVLGVEREAYCAGFDSAGAAQTWSSAPELQERLKRAVTAARAPIYFFQAQNDFDLSPTEVLSATMRDAAKPHVAKVYPPYGSSKANGHTLGYFGFSIWGDDVLAFLGQHCPKR
jgi:dienelactone hydrolase